jgi:hypothetical protein
LDNVIIYVGYEDKMNYNGDTRSYFCVFADRWMKTVTIDNSTILSDFDGRKRYSDQY